MPSVTCCEPTIGVALWDRLAAKPGPGAAGPARAQDFVISADAVRFTVVSAARAREPVLARLVVAADGAHSQIRAVAGIAADVVDYDQLAVVATVATDRAHQDIAYERFTRTGALAVLPLYDGNTGVIGLPPAARERTAGARRRRLPVAAAGAVPAGAPGASCVPAGRSSYALKLTRACATVATRTVLIGNAAQALHPVAARDSISGYATPRCSRK